MTDLNLQAAEPTGYRATAAELRRIADAIEHLELDLDVPYVTLSFLPSTHGASDEQRISDVDAVASAVLGRLGQHEENAQSWYHLARATRSGIHITIQEPISAPPDEREAELARLREENARLRAAAALTPDADPTGLLHSRADEGPAEDMTLTRPGQIPPTDPGDLPQPYATFAEQRAAYESRSES